LSLKDFSDPDVNLKDVFNETPDKADFTLLDRVSTAEGSPVVVSFDLPFRTINQATLKTNLISAEGFGIGDFKNEFKLTSFTINGKRFEVSDPRASVNLIDKLNDGALNKVLKPFNNVLGVNFSAPIGAGFVLPNAEISAILTVFGERDPFSLANLPNTTQLTKNVSKLVGKATGIGIIALIAIIIIGIVLIIFGARAKNVKDIAGSVT
jgi:hypothetical protein